eukprot:Rhum_TRINITY_DN13826_c3_g1::Rhum_TRINITY_DN13826_c3_g1_i1::g.65002::m.65002
MLLVHFCAAGLAHGHVRVQLAAGHPSCCNRRPGAAELLLLQRFQLLLPLPLRLRVVLLLLLLLLILCFVSLGVVVGVEAIVVLTRLHRHVQLLQRLRRQTHVVAGAHRLRRRGRGPSLLVLDVGGRGVVVVVVVLLQELLKAGGVALVVACGLDALVEGRLLLRVDVKLGDVVAFHLEAAAEEVMDALDVSVEVELGVGVRGGRHLREVDDHKLLVFRDHQVELVEVTVDKPVLREPDDEVDRLLEYLVRLRQLAHVRERVSVDLAHQHNVAVLVDRLRHREALRAKSHHEAVLLDGGKAGEVEPRLAAHGTPVLVVAVLLHGPEGGTAETLQLHDHLAVVLVGDDEHVGLLAHTDLVADVAHRAALHKGAHGQVVVGHVVHAVAVVVLAVVQKEVVLQQPPQALPCAACLQSRNLLHEHGRRDLVVPRGQLNGGHHAEVLLVHPPQERRIEANHCLRGLCTKSKTVHCRL